MSISPNIKIRFDELINYQPVLKNLAQPNLNASVINQQSFINNLNRTKLNQSRQTLESKSSDIKKPKIKEDIVDTRLTRKNLNSYYFNDRLTYNKIMNKVESWLNDYPKSGVLYPYFDLSDKKNR